MTAGFNDRRFAKGNWVRCLHCGKAVPAYSRKKYCPQHSYGPSHVGQTLGCPACDKARPDTGVAATSNWGQHLLGGSGHEDGSPRYAGGPWGWPDGVAGPPPGEEDPGPYQPPR